MALSAPQSATQLVTQLALRLTSGDTDPIRGMKMADGRSVFSVFDAMWNTGAYAGRSGVKMAFARLIADGSEYRDEVVKACDYLKFSGSGQRETPCMDIRGLQRLIALLGGKIREEYRRLAEIDIPKRLLLRLASHSQHSTLIKWPRKGRLTSR